MELPAYDDANGWVAFIAAQGRNVKIEALMRALGEPTPITGIAQEVVIKQIKSRAKAFAYGYVSRKSELAAENIVDEAMHEVDLAIAQPQSKDAEYCRTYFFVFVKHRIFDAYSKRKRTSHLNEDMGYAPDENVGGAGNGNETNNARQVSGEGADDGELERLRSRWQAVLGSIPNLDNRRAIEMRFEGYTWAEIAVELKETVGAVKWRVKKSLPPKDDASEK